MESSNLSQVIVFSLLGGVFSLIGGLFLLRNQKSADGLAKYATPFAAGALLSAVFLDLLKDGVEESSADTVLLAALAGIVGFFLLERFLRWFHHHHDHQGKENDHTVGMIIIGDTLHNVLDGVAIAASFLVSPATGIITTLAVAAHEIPQEIGDFGLLLAKGMRRRNVLLVNILSALGTLVAAVITFTLGSNELGGSSIGWLTGVSAGFLLYIAMSDLIPSIHDSAPKNKLLDWRPLLFIFGVLVVGISIRVAHTAIEPSHGHDEEASEQVHAEDEH